jgi:PhzF family phenazine biosynthesis protein
MKLKIFQVDAFTENLFGGNPAAVIPLDHWLPDTLMQKIAAENNLAETAFFISKGNDYHLRWFAPTVEVDLCGHATLATAHVMFTHLGYNRPQINFDSRSGMLSVQKEGNRLTLDFPKDDPQKIDTPKVILDAIHIKPVEVCKGKNFLLVVLNSQKEIEELNPVINEVAKAHRHGVIFTAKGNETDFVSRCFFPNSGIDEDPVTGSAHTMLAPYWSARLGKTRLNARQLSKRMGNLECEIVEDRIKISGQAVTYLKGEIELNDTNGSEPKDINIESVRMAE